MVYSRSEDDYWFERHIDDFVVGLRCCAYPRLQTAPLTSGPLYLPTDGFNYDGVVQNPILLTLVEVDIKNQNTYAPSGRLVCRVERRVDYEQVIFPAGIVLEFLLEEGSWSRTCWECRGDGLWPGRSNPADTRFECLTCRGARIQTERKIGFVFDKRIYSQTGGWLNRLILNPDQDWPAGLV